MSIEDDKEETERCLSETDSRINSHISISNTAEPSYENSNVAIFEVKNVSFFSCFNLISIYSVRRMYFHGVIMVPDRGIGLG